MAIICITLAFSFIIDESCFIMALKAENPHFIN